MLQPHYISKDKKFYLVQGDCMEIMPCMKHKFDMVFADPPYFLSNNGLSVQNGKIVSVNKGEWDKSKGNNYINGFNRKWLQQVRELMKEDATIWISGTMHNIFSIGQLLTELDFKILNIITWQKTNPPPNFSCRYFTHSTEQIIWARKSKKVPHYYNYELMKKLNGNKQMKDVWTLPAIAKWEKSCHKHPTQKPLSVLTRAIIASTKPDAWILDPFAGSSTTGIAANLSNRRFVGIEKEEEYLGISKRRKIEIENSVVAHSYKHKINGFINRNQLEDFLNSEPVSEEKVALGFCRKKDLTKLTNTNKFYFHCIEDNNKVKDFPVEILDAKWLYIYQGTRNKAKFLSGHYGEIDTIKLKHKEQIEGKTKSKTEFYYEVLMKSNFIEEDKLKVRIQMEELFSTHDKVNIDLFKKALPAVTTRERIDNIVQ